MVFSFGALRKAHLMLFKILTKKDRKLEEATNIKLKPQRSGLIKFNFGETKEELSFFFREFNEYSFGVLRRSFFKFETNKTFFAASLYRQRGKNARRFIHSGMVGLTAMGIMIAPVLAKEFPAANVDPWQIPVAATVLSATSSNSDLTTEISSKPRDKVTEYTVQEGDTVSSIARKFGISEDTVLWQNNLSKTSRIKPGQTLQILPVTGVLHKVQKGDTVYNIAKKYDSEAQAIVDFPFNTFVNDETFELAIGQTVIVPDGVKQTNQGVVTPRIRQLTPDAGTVVASGSFVWPSSGTITQYYAWYHPGIDVANRAAPDVLAADSGRVIASGWDGTGYGNRVIIDHGNGYQTLYGHMQRLYVVPGQTISRGAAIGKMGSTGHSTGTHLHFEVRTAGGRVNPLKVLN
jgi:murein DD-endopeptidase MepM/ murein hydrolase activator NlpD